MSNCPVCPAKAQCEKTGREKLMSQLGQCRNCKAMLFIGKWEHSELNRGHKITIECVASFWKIKDLVEDVLPKGRCGICGGFPLRVMRWGKKSEMEAFQTQAQAK